MFWHEELPYLLRSTIFLELFRTVYTWATRSDLSLLRGSYRTSRQNQLFLMWNVFASLGSSFRSDFDSIVIVSKLIQSAEQNTFSVCPTPHTYYNPLTAHDKWEHELIAKHCSSCKFTHFCSSDFRPKLTHRWPPKQLRCPFSGNKIDNYSKATSQTRLPVANCTRSSWIVLDPWYT